MSLAEEHASAPALALVVDDDSTTRLFARQTLELAGIRVAEAEDGEHGLDEFARLKPDIVLLDVMMPVMNGFDVCRTLRSNPAGLHVPVLMMTGLDDVASIDRSPATATRREADRK